MVARYHENFEKHGRNVQSKCLVSLFALNYVLLPTSCLACSTCCFNIAGIKGLLAVMMPLLITVISEDQNLTRAIWHSCAEKYLWTKGVCNTPNIFPGYILFHLHHKDYKVLIHDTSKSFIMHHVKQPI